MTATETRLGVLIERLRDDLRAALTPEGIAQLVLFVAASELLVEDLQRADAGRLRLAVGHLALSTLGVSDASIERAKTSLAQGRDPATLDRQH